ncbi:Transcription factor GTE12 [Striga hermonthica]|uniref:Transcription factor GTE12 n=1 Tax=Striga hermonthica TaxID=68872 RepID=A0A9N7NK29_STRHE|nr:Transcription factor GTE12 [Striga hermonthica]
MPFPTMTTAIDTAPRNLKFKITSRGIRSNSEVKPQDNASKGLLKNGQKVNKISESGNICSQLNANPTGPATPAKRKPEVSFDGQTRKRGKMDRTLKCRCENILKKLMSHTGSFIFREPVDPVKLNIPDYFSIITKPMDLGTIKCKLDGNKYFSAEEFAADVKLAFSNATTYNPPGNYVHELAKEMGDCFSRSWKSLGVWLKQRNGNDEKGSFVHHVENNGRANKQTVANHHQGAKLAGLSQRSFVSLPDDRSSRNLRTKVSAADGTCGKVKPITLKGCSSSRAVEKEPCSQSSSAPGKQSQPVDSVEAKCCSCGNSTCHCRLKDASAQASKSDISSERSSENNQCGDSDSKPYSEVKRSSAIQKSSSSLESQGPGVVIHEEKSPDFPNPSTTALSSTEGWASLNAQMSPNKALRVAMLKSRFADTIFRATHQVEKVDPMRMKQERERLEREKLEEKARIEAEIKAAEAASRRERDELRMKRERERAAARMALQKMEKSVEINESMDIVKDVEMLCFGFQAGKTLERFGLYLKEDYLEDEEDEDAILNAEEGEIL